MSKVPYQNVKVQTLPGGGWEITGENPVQTTPPKPTILAPVIRESAKIDVELIKAFKLRAVQEGRFIYEVMEEALRDYLKK